MKKLSWFSPTTGENMGYGYAAFNLVQALNQNNLVVNFDDPLAKAHINWIQPLWYRDTDLHRYNIGYTPWESTELDESWVWHMNKMDEIWTPATFCKEIFEESGVVKPVHVVAHGVNPIHYPICDRSLDMAHDTFIFLHVGGPTERKGAQRVVDAFIDCFDENENTLLVLKASEFSEAKIDVNGRRYPAEAHPGIKVITADFSIKEMTMLYANAHCMVYPSNGEGFGFIPFQAIATGMPTICTNGTAMSDFAHLSMPLKWSWTEGQGIHLGMWCEPDPGDLREQMIHVYNNWELEKTKALASAKWIHENQTWDHIAKQVINMVGDKLDE